MIHKNSSNSSKPLSSEISKPKRNKSLQKTSGKKPCEQPEHEGTTLHINDNPDEIVELKPH